jgi:hypothetical protein
MKNVVWLIQYLEVAIPKRQSHDVINLAIDNFLESLHQMEPGEKAISFLMGEGNNVAGSEKSPIVLKFINEFEDAILQVFPPGSRLHFELAKSGCYLPISNHFYCFRDSKQKVLFSYNNDLSILQISNNEHPTDGLIFPTLKKIEATISRYKAPQTARERIRHLSEIFIHVERECICEHIDIPDLFLKDLNSLRYVSEVLLAISQVGEKTIRGRSSVDLDGRSKISDLCDVCFRHVVGNSLYCVIHDPVQEENAYRRAKSSGCSRSKNAEQYYSNIRTKSKSIQEAIQDRHLLPNNEINFRHLLINEINTSPWIISRPLFWKFIEAGFPKTFKRITVETKNSSSWEETAIGIWRNLNNLKESTIDPDISIGTLIEAEIWFAGEESYKPKNYKKELTNKIIALLNKGIKQSEIARLLGCSRAYVSKIKKQILECSK